ncbi:16S rRNA (cytosine(1402)-N(4))-methyltransferase RsmH [Agilicoccus flavus]|uniref:16S rRNA (cytosine(1402)-N(4))-methyltransferase RsmH n=1 Tax=Agilicoccus flavus TaxID=2775968 RepID=UPI001CF6738E|nr:16S rRNA (cytosine(1402)-N(4))-methyltransferase RsmH [Agilicoccus flavus]
MAATREGSDAHVPVMLDRCVEILAPALTRRDPSAPAPVFVDGTLGMGGHTEAILLACPDAVAIGIDRDPQALEIASRRLARFGDRFRPARAVYDEIGDVVADAGFAHADAILLDLGVSSLQLDEADRGFAYSRPAPLDMRMDTDGGLTAADVLNTYAHGDLARILRDYGEERFAGRIASAVVAEREAEPFTGSARLVELLYRVIPAASRRTGGHPAKRTFQALRIEVNGELDSLAAAIPAALHTLGVGGRVAVLSYHSLEDRMVKRALAAASTGTAPPGFPVELPEHAPELRLLTRGGEEPGEAEVGTNPRAASARLRAAERIRPATGRTRTTKTRTTSSTTTKNSTTTKGRPR